MCSVTAPCSLIIELQWYPLESRLGAAFNNSGDLCSIRQISQFRTFKMIIHDYHNMQHHNFMAMPCGHTPQIGYKGAKLTIEMKETGRVHHVKL